MGWPTANIVPPDIARETIAFFACVHDVSAEQVLGERRLQHLVNARLDIIKCLVIDLGYTAHSVAKAMNRDHTTLRHHLRKLSPTALNLPVSLVDSAKTAANTYGCHAMETAR